jgi:hypothetical protein
MFKKFFLTVVLFFCMAAVAVAGCIVPQGTHALLATPAGMEPVTANRDIEVKVDPPEKQPPLDLLRAFSAKVGENWTDGVSIEDPTGAHLLVHSSSLHCD